MLGRDLFELFPELPKPWFSKKVKTVFTLSNFAFISWKNRPFLFKFAHNRPITGGVEHMYQNCTLLPLKDDQGRPEAVCVVLMDATDVAMAQGQLHEAMRLLADSSNRDGLTGVCNRRCLEDRMKAEFERARRYGGTFSLMLFDMDHFKAVNDRCGHLGGDAVLLDIARRASELLRASDVVGRYGGEEYDIILPNTPLEGAAQFCERPRSFVQQCPVEFDGTDIPVTICMGVTE